MDWSSKQCARDRIEMPADVGVATWQPRSIDIERDRFISSLLHFNVPQPVQLQCDKSAESADGYVLSLLLLFCVLVPIFRASVYE